MRFDFVGDFSRVPTRVELEGDRAKKKFVAKYFQSNALLGVVLCNQSEEKLEAAQAEMRARPRPKRPAQD